MADATLRGGLATLINHHSRENQSNTPDFLLASYLMTCLEAFETAVQLRDSWHVSKERKAKEADTE